MGMITDLVNGIPTVNAVPVVHGVWHVNDSECDPYYTCSLCGWALYTSDGEHPHLHGMIYCPHCSAKLDKEIEVDGEN